MAIFISRFFLQKTTQKSFFATKKLIVLTLTLCLHILLPLLFYKQTTIEYVKEQLLGQQVLKNTNQNRHLAIRQGVYFT